MKIFLTGATGFLGKALQEEWKNSLQVITSGRDRNAMVVCDLSINIPHIPPVDMVVHAAGKAHMVPKNEEQEKDFYTVNVKGTENLLEGLENNSLLKKFVYISSVSVYGSTAGSNINEQTPLLASEPYGKSKIAAEQLVSAWCSRKKIDYYLLRLPLMAGKNAPGNLGAMVNGIQSGRYLSIGKADAKKSMILAADLATFIENIDGPSGAYNLTDGYHPSFKELEHLVSRHFKKKDPRTIPFFVARLIGFAGDLAGNAFPINSNKLKKITSTLTFDDRLARTQLQWSPRKVLKKWEIE